MILLHSDLHHHFVEGDFEEIIYGHDSVLEQRSVEQRAWGRLSTLPPVVDEA